MQYVVFDLSALKEMYNTIVYNLGNIFGIGIYVFCLVLGIFTVISIIERVGQ